MIYNEIRNKHQWDNVISGFNDSTVYHSFDYTSTCAEEENAYDFKLIHISYREAEFVIPVLVRAIVDSRYFDMSSTYGYPGPLFKGEWTHANLKKCWAEFTTIQSDRFVVCLVSRLNPFLQNENLLNTIGMVRDVNNIVVIDTEIPESEQIAAYSKNHKRDIKKLINQGVACREIDPMLHLDEFLEIYYSEMNRMGADRRYFFSTRYFKRLLSAGKYTTKMFACFVDNNIASIGLFIIGSNHIHYHLGATRFEYQKIAPSKLMFDNVRKYAIKIGAKGVNLGGGRGGINDSLWRFKSGFSDRHFMFKILMSVFDNATYNSLVTRQQDRIVKSGVSLDTDYFPTYRAPLKIK